MNPAPSSTVPALHGLGAPSSWVQRWSHLVQPKGRVLDVACGAGRHSRWFAQRQHAVVAVDRAPEALAALPAGVEAVCADLEGGPWPFPGQTFDAVVVTNYLWRPLFPVLLASLAPGGVLIYETFALGNESVGKPSRPDFLLRPAELLQAFDELEIVAYEAGFEASPERFVQRLCAVRPDGQPNGAPARYPLTPLSATPG